MQDKLNSSEFTYVCADCFDDIDLKDYIQEQASEKQCDFCGNSSDNMISVSIQEIADYIQACFSPDYDSNPYEQLHYDSERGEFDAWTSDTYDLLRYQLGIEFPNDNDNKLLDAIVNALGEDLWCEKHGYERTEYVIYKRSWNSFCGLIKYKKRFFFMDDEDDPTSVYMNPVEMLDSIAELCSELALCVEISAGKELYRVRMQDGTVDPKSPFEIGPPPRDSQVLSNRMSPPGVVMFYVSENEETSLRETVTNEGKYIIGRFVNDKTITLLDFGKLPLKPRYFDIKMVEIRNRLLFLHSFVEEVAKSIDRNDSINVEYIPTQVVTEYFKHKYLYNGKHINGIRYPSSRHPGFYCIVLFADSGDIVDKNKTTVRARKYSRALFDSSIESGLPMYEMLDSKEVFISGDQITGWSV